MRAAVATARQEEFIANLIRVLNPTMNRWSCRLSYLKPWLAGLAPDDRDAFFDPSRRENIPDTEADKVATMKLAIDGHVEQREVAGIPCRLEPDPIGPTMFGRSGRF